jgi:hypothetical protein
MKKHLLFLCAFVTMGASLAFAQVSPQQRQDERATEGQSGINDTVDVVTPPSVDQVTNHSAVLRWGTNKTAATRVNYGTDPNTLGQSAFQPGGTTNHEVMLRNLRPRTTYYFAIENKHGQGRLTGTFTTQ